MKLFKMFFFSALTFSIVEDAPAADSASVTSDTDVQQTGTEALETAQAAVESEIAAASPNVDSAATADSGTAASTESTVDVGNESVEDADPVSTASTTTDFSIVDRLEAEIEKLGTALTADLRAVWAELKAAL